MIDPQDTQDGGFLCGVWCVFWLQKEFQPPPVLTRPPLVVDADAADDRHLPCCVNQASPFSVLSDFGRVTTGLALPFKLDLQASYPPVSFFGRPPGGRFLPVRSDR